VALDTNLIGYQDYTTTSPSGVSKQLLIARYRDHSEGGLIVNQGPQLIEPGIFRTGAESYAEQLIIVFRSAAHSDFGSCGFVYYRWRLHHDWHKCCDDSTFTRGEVLAGFEFSKRTIAGPGWVSPRFIMSTSTTNWASSISRQLHATKKILQDTVFNAKYV
jgi:hypothetical protein